MDLDELLGIDPNDPMQQNAQQLVEADERLLDRLVALRHQQGLTQADIAERLGVHQSSIARIEHGERDPHLSTLRRYALAVGARVEHSVSLFETTQQQAVKASTYRVVFASAVAAFESNRVREFVLHTWATTPDALTGRDSLKDHWSLIDEDELSRSRALALR